MDEVIERITKLINEKFDQNYDEIEMDEIMYGFVLDDDIFIEYITYLLSINDDEIDDYISNCSMDGIDDARTTITDKKLEEFIRKFEQKREEFNDTYANILDIETERLILKPVKEDELDFFKSKEESSKEEGFSDEIEKYYRKGFVYSIVLKETREIVGCMHLVEFNTSYVLKSQDTFNLSYHVFNEYRGNGYCTEAVKGIVSFVYDNKLKYLDGDKYTLTFEEKILKPAIIRIIADKDNLSSNRVALNSGFRFEGTISSCEAEEIRDYSFYSIINPNYFKK